MENSNWQYVGITSEETPFEIDGIDIWQAKWQPSKLNKFEAPHPSYPSQKHQMSPFQIDINGGILNFAACEVSANVYVFYKQSCNT